MTEAEIIARILKPLVWVEDAHQTFRAENVTGCEGVDFIREGETSFYESWGSDTQFPTLAAAQAAAEADYRARIAAALDLGPVVALVEAMERYATRYMQDEASDPDVCVPGQHNDAKAVFATLAAFRGASGGEG